MDADEIERKKWAMLNMGTGMPAYWAQIVEMQRTRVAGWQRQMAELLRQAREDKTPWPKMNGADARFELPRLMAADGIYLVVAARKVQATVEICTKLRPRDSDLGLMLAAFERDATDLGNARDLLVHMEDYLLETKSRQLPFDSDDVHGTPRIRFEPPDEIMGDPHLLIGPYSISLGKLSAAVAALAAAADVWLYAEWRKVGGT